jgi:hypothetical protein
MERFPFHCFLRKEYSNGRGSANLTWIDNFFCNTKTPSFVTVRVKESPITQTKSDYHALCEPQAAPV